MTYRELLKRCETEPGLLADKEQRDVDSFIRYRSWVEELNEKYQIEKSKNEKATHWSVH